MFNNTIYVRPMAGYEDTAATDWKMGQDFFTVAGGPCRYINMYDVSYLLSNGVRTIVFVNSQGSTLASVGI